MSSSSESSDSYLGGGDEDEREYDAFDYEEECASEDDGERFIREGQLVQPRPRSPKKSLIKAFTDLVEKGYQVASPSSKDAEVLSKKLGVSSEKFDKLNLYRKVNPELAKLFANELTRHADAIKDRLAKNYELLGDLYSRVPEGQRHLQVQINNIVANEKKVAGVADEMKDYADKFLHGEVVIKNDALAILK